MFDEMLFLFCDGGGDGGGNHDGEEFQNGFDKSKRDNGGGLWLRATTDKSMMASGSAALPGRPTRPISRCLSRSILILALCSCRVEVFCAP